jgi:small GTP-binding protein
MLESSDVISLKTVVVGNGLAGKTSMILTQRMGVFPGDYRPLVADRGEHVCQVDERNFTLTVFDTGGGEDYHRIRPLFYPGTDCFLLLFDVSNKYDDFDEVKSLWWRELRHYCPKVPVILVASKIDLRDVETTKTISTEKGLKMAERIGAAKYMELSSLKKVGLKELFEEVVRIGFAYHIAPKEENKGMKCQVL